MNALLARIASFSLAMTFAQNALSAELNLPRNGWATWDVPAVSDTPAWCCFSFDGDADRSSNGNPVCRLEGTQNGYSSRDGETTATVRLYARFADGKLSRLRALAPSCPVEAHVTPQVLTDVSVDDSARWLASLLDSKHDAIGVGRRQRTDVMASLAAHRTSLAYDALVSVARNDELIATRKDAVFWLAHLRGIEGARFVTSVMFEDADARMREHATFAVSQSKSATKAGDLIVLATTDRKARVRTQAWFWLAQIGASETEAAIGSALKTETDDSVRNQAVFALSQLPDERAVRALIGVAEDSSLAREDRKQAIFWLAQEESDAALTYLDRVIAAKATF
ncbi:MAG TPA: HEAT repeat domain-containing protein [Steroidobacteraceae bacterium]|nr:HEAT repeat domain-containing protein [Steroidobacteraceae bacterium]